MSRQRQRKLTRSERNAHRAKHQRQEQRERQEQQAVVHHIAEAFTGDVSIARDFADQCSSRLDELGFDVECSQLAVELWDGRPEPVVELLREIAAEQERHSEAMEDLFHRFCEIANSGAEPVRLGGAIDHYREIVRRRLFEPPPATQETEALRAAYGPMAKEFEGMFRSAFQRTSVPCTVSGCAGTMRYVAGTDREPSTEERRQYPGAAVAFVRECGVCGYQAPSVQGGMEFGGA